MMMLVGYVFKTGVPIPNPAHKALIGRLFLQPGKPAISAKDEHKIWKTEQIRELCSESCVTRPDAIPFEQFRSYYLKPNTLQTTLRPTYVFCMWTYVVEDVHPSLHSDALENSENSKEDVVKFGDAIVGSNPAVLTGGAVSTGPRWSVQATGELTCLLTYSRRHKDLYRFTFSVP